MGLLMKEKKALTREVSKRYQQAQKKEKSTILDEVVKTTGYNRKYALHILANWGKTSTVRLSGKAVRLRLRLARGGRAEAESLSIPRSSSQPSETSGFSSGTAAGKY